MSLRNFEQFDHLPVDNRAMDFDRLLDFARQRLTPNGSIERAPESTFPPNLPSSAEALPMENLRYAGLNG